MVTLGASNNNDLPEGCLGLGPGTRDGSAAVPGRGPFGAVETGDVEKGMVGALEGDGNFEVSNEGEETGNRLVLIFGDEPLE